MNTGISTTDTALPADTERSELEVQVHYRLHGRVRDLRVLDHGGGVVLRGRARSYYVKQLAQHAVMDATDLPVLANEIEVG